MSRERVAELLPVMQAYADGKAIQYKINGEWVTGDEYEFSFDGTGEYRVKPEPRTFWVNVYDDGGMSVILGRYSMCYRTKDAP